MLSSGQAAAALVAPTLHTRAGVERCRNACLAPPALILNGEWFTLGLELLNFEIMHFPVGFKLSTIFKHGTLDLANRDICCGNFLLSTPFSWLNRSLVPYILRLGVLPAGKIALGLAP